MSNVKLTFDAPEDHVLELDGKTYHGGDEFSVDAKRIPSLLEAGVPIGDPASALERLSKEDLEELARERGVEAEGKTKAELGDALATPVEHVPPGGPEPIHADLTEGRKRQTKVADHTPTTIESEED